MLITGTDREVVQKRYRAGVFVLFTRRSNWAILKEINPEYSLEGMMVKVKFQYFVHLMQRADSLGRTLMLGKTEGKRRRGGRRRDD